VWVAAGFPAEKSERATGSFVYWKEWEIEVLKK
jgi:hypothetical protein